MLDEIQADGLNIGGAGDFLYGLVGVLGMMSDVMKPKRGFSKEIVAAIREGKILGIRAGTKPHRIIGIWAVVVEGRVF